MWRRNFACVLPIPSSAYASAASDRRHRASVLRSSRNALASRRSSRLDDFMDGSTVFIDGSMIKCEARALGAPVQWAVLLVASLGLGALLRAAQIPAGLLLGP